MTTAKIRKIFIDMDGVLADFDAWKRTVQAERPEVNDDETLWEVVKDYDHFYLHLPVCPDAPALMQYLRSLDTPLCILTALPRRRVIPNSAEDKEAWIRKHIDPSIEFRIGPYAVDKQNHCEGEGHVLIDDSRLNIPQWNAKGGHGILFHNLDQTLKELDSLVHD